MKPWKELEKEVARRLDGARVIRERWDKRDCDVRHQVYSIECKFRNDFGGWYNQLLKKMRFKDESMTAEREPSDFILEAIEQARQYCSTKPPLAVVKKKGMEYDDALVFMMAKDFPRSVVRHIVLVSDKPLLAYTGLKEFTAYWQRERYKLLPEPVRYEG